MLTNPHDIIEAIIEEEGGDKVVFDTGKTTKWGISEKGTGMSAEKIKSLTKDEAIEFYFKEYYQPLKRLPADILHCCIDAAVNMGKRQMVKILQRAGGLSGADVDGYLGPKTYAAAATVTASDFRVERFLFYENLVQAQPEKYEKYRMGWLKRTMRV
jgi:lysozyme family protein